MNTQPGKSVLDKLWVIHDREAGVTSMVKYITMDKTGNYIVAVSRAVKSVDDNMFNRRLGRHFAEARMLDHFDEFKRKYLKTSRDKRKPLTISSHVRRHPGTRKHNEVVLFAVGEEHVMNLHELEVWHNVILPNIEAELEFGF